MKTTIILNILILLLIFSFSVEYGWSQDILVNNKSGDTVGIAVHNYQSVAMDWAGNVVAVWTDNRNVHHDVWMQRFDADGNPIEGNQRVNDDQGTDDQNCSRVAMDKDGDFVVVWHDNRDGDYNIYAQRFDSSGNPVGSNFKVNDDTGVARQVEPSIGMDSNGNFVVAWIDGRDGWQDIYAQRFDNTGTSVGANLRVNESTHKITGRGRVNVSMSNAGIFGVTWTNDENQAWSDLYVRFFNWATGESIASTSTIAFGSQIYGPHIDMDDAGISTIIWCHFGSVMARRYDLSGNLIKSTYRIDDSSWNASPAWEPSPAIAVRPSGEFVVCFEESSGGTWYVRARRFDSSGNAIGASFKVDVQQALNGVIAIKPITPEGQFTVVYKRKSTGDLYARRFDWAETPLGDSILLNDDGNHLSQNAPKIAIATPDTFMVVWSDARGKGTDSTTEGSIFHISGGCAVPMGENFRIPGDGWPWKSHGYPDISGSASGRFVVVGTEDHWGYYSNSWKRTSICVYDVSGTRIASKLHYTNDWGDPIEPSVAINRSGSFVVAKMESLPSQGEGHEKDIFLTFFKPDASVLKDDIRVNPSGDNNASQYNPQVAMNNDTVLVAWNDPEYGRDDVWARLYSFPDGSALTDEFIVHEDISQTGHYLAGVAIDDDGRSIITWNDHREGDWDIYARRFDSDGTPIGPEFKVNDNELPGVEQKGGDVVMTSPENGDFAITWSDCQDGDPDVYIRLYGSDGNPKGDSFRISALHDSQQLIPAVTGTKDNIIATWLDNRHGDWDVHVGKTKCKPGDVSGDGTISAYDAALILQFVVGLIDEFPSECMAASTTVTPRNYSVSLSNLQTTGGKTIYAPITINETAGLTAGGIVLTYDPTVLKAVDVAPLSTLSSSYWKANFENMGEVRFAFASASEYISYTDNKQANLLLIKFETLPNIVGKVSPLILDTVQLANSQSITKINGSVTILPERTVLMQNYPNPFNPETWLPYQLAIDANVTISIYNIKGELIRNLHLGDRSAGVYVVKNKAAYWDGRDNTGEKVASGVYYYTLHSGNFITTRKMVILK